MNSRFLACLVIICPLLLFETEASTDNSTVDFATEMWPGEGIPQFRAKKDIIPLREPRKDSEIVEGLKIGKGENIEFTKTHFKSVKTGTIIIDQPIQFEATNYGERNYLSKGAYYHSGKRIDLTLKKGDVLTVLMQRAEGDIFFMFQDEIFSGSCDPCWEADFETEWWIRVNQDSKSGWILQDGSSVEFLGRGF